MVREAIVWCGGADPVVSQDHIRRDDPLRQELRAVVYAWAAVFGAQKMTAADVKRRSRGSPLHDALIPVVGRADEINTGSLGKWLSKKKGVRLDGAHFEVVGQRQGTALWRLEDAEGLVGTVS
jgi:hypothetical protein